MWSKTSLEAVLLVVLYHATSSSLEIQYASQRYIQVCQLRSKVRHSSSIFIVIIIFIFFVGSCLVSNLLCRTLGCTHCDEGAVRGHVGYDDELCAKCDGTIKTWDTFEANKILTLSDGWCSWCIENTQHEVYL